MAHMRLFLLSSPFKKTPLRSPTFKFGHVAENGTLQNWALENKVKIEKKKDEEENDKKYIFLFRFSKVHQLIFPIILPAPSLSSVIFKKVHKMIFFSFFHLYLFLLSFFDLLYPFLIKKSRKRWNENNKTGKKKREKRFVWGNEFLNC